ncbi:hypothetical protein AI19_11915 [Thalassolituus oleivorans 4BN06-13]|nr:hypothetical protein [Thalassolituus oleivorans 4BN06-13]
MIMNEKLDSLVCVILSGGKGTRLQSVVQDVPKPMADISGEPFLSLLLTRMIAQGVRKFVLSVGYKRDVIINYYRENPIAGVDIQFAEEVEPLGTGGGIKHAASVLDSSNYLVLNGDSTCAADISDFIESVEQSDQAAGVLVNHQDDCARYGQIVFDPVTHRSLEMKEKNPNAGAGYINAGVYLLPRDFIASLPNGAFSFEEVGFPLLMENGLYAYGNTNKFIDIGVPEDYYAVCANKSYYFPEVEGV